MVASCLSNVNKYILKVAHGGKTSKIRRDIPGMCHSTTEVIWKDPSEQHLVVFTMPSETSREEDYWKVIASASFDR